MDMGYHQGIKGDGFKVWNSGCYLRHFRLSALLFPELCLCDPFDGAGVHCSQTLGGLLRDEGYRIRVKGSGLGVGGWGLGVAG